MSWWWTKDEYSSETPVPTAFYQLAGTNGPAVVKVFSEGKTEPGWGLKAKGPGFITKYKAGQFSIPRINGWIATGCPFALIMRSVQMVCIDIDGKNDGLLHAGKLGMLPPTLAEESKSGSGYHIFYSVSDDTWSNSEGFGGYPDKIGLEQGVDIRSVGCVYHYPGQKWNSRDVAELPDHLKKRLKQGPATTAARIKRIEEALEGDPDELLMIRADLMDGLAAQIPQGRRNTTLYAIGQQMKAAQIEGWEKLVAERGEAVGLSTEEARKIVQNVLRYAP